MPWIIKINQMFVFSNLAALTTSAFLSWINGGRRDLKTTTPGHFGHRLAIKTTLKYPTRIVYVV